MGSFLRGLIQRRPLAAVGMVVLAVVALAAVGAPWLPLPPRTGSTWPPASSPSPGHPFGTDSFGRDVLSRVIASGRVSLAIGVAVMALSTVVGTAAGLVAGYYGRVDAVLMHVLDGVMAFPALLLAIALVAALGASARNEAIAIALVYFPRTARIVHAADQDAGLRRGRGGPGGTGWADPGRPHPAQRSPPAHRAVSTFVFAEAILADVASRSWGSACALPRQPGATCWTTPTST